jgi:hypothetical protein
LIECDEKRVGGLVFGAEHGSTKAMDRHLFDCGIRTGGSGRLNASTSP